MDTMKLPKIPCADVTVVSATLADLPEIDVLQKANSKALGFLPRAALEGKVKLGEVLVARSPGGRLAGYVIGSDSYHKREEVGVVYQMAVDPGHRRKNVGAVLLRELFASWPWGTRLCCAWCAQDLAANEFWEAMGFMALAYRAGRSGRDKGTKGLRDTGAESESGFGTSSLRPSVPSSLPRTHIFWQKRVHAEDETTPWWYPSVTGSGVLREDRVVLPIPADQHWRDARPIVLPTVGEEVVEPAAKASDVEERDGQFYKNGKRLVTAEMCRREADVPHGGPFLVPKECVLVKKLPTAKKPAREKKRPMYDPTLASAVRELRDRWLAHANAGGLLLPAEKYDVSRPTALPCGDGLQKLLAVQERKLLAA